MKALLTLLVLLMAQQPEFVKGKGFKGYIFDADAEVHVYFKEKPGRFTPTKDDIILCEKLVKEYVNFLITEETQGKKLFQAIQKDLKRYVRQYVGFINEKGEKVIWINMLYWRSSFLEDVNRRVIHVSDGGTSYWNVKINLQNKEAYELAISMG